MKGPDSVPAPAREAHRHACTHWCFCYVPNREACEKCRHNEASQRMRAEYERSEAEIVR